MSGQVVIASKLLELLDNGAPQDVLFRIGKGSRSYRIGLGQAVSLLFG